MEIFFFSGINKNLENQENQKIELNLLKKESIPLDTCLSINPENYLKEIKNKLREFWSKAREEFFQKELEGFYICGNEILNFLNEKNKHKLKNSHDSKTYFQSFFQDLETPLGKNIFHESDILFTDMLS
jgi:hypothetical protein